MSLSLTNKDFNWGKMLCSPFQITWFKWFGELLSTWCPSSVHLSSSFFFLHFTFCSFAKIFNFVLLQQKVAMFISWFWLVEALILFHSETKSSNTLLVDTTNVNHVLHKNIIISYGSRKKNNIAAIGNHNKDL